MGDGLKYNKDKSSRKHEDVNVYYQGEGDHEQAKRYEQTSAMVHLTRLKGMNKCKQMINKSRFKSMKGSKQVIHTRGSRL